MMTNNAAKKQTGKTLAIGGRQWQPTPTRILQAALAIERASRQAALDPSDTLDQAARRIAGCLLDRGKLHSVCGLLLAAENIPTKAWTDADARRASQFFAGLTNEADQALLREIVVHFATGFLEATTTEGARAHAA